MYTAPCCTELHANLLRVCMPCYFRALQKLKSAKEQALQKATASGQGAESTAAPTEDPAAPAGKKASKASTNEAETSGAAAEREQQNEEADQQQQPEELAQPKRRVLTAQDASLPDTELSSLQLCELATCPESIALGMAVRLATVRCNAFALLLMGYADLPLHGALLMQECCEAFLL